MSKSFFKALITVGASIVFFIFVPMLFIPGWPPLGLSGCSGKLTDEELIDNAVATADSLLDIARLFPKNCRDSLRTEKIIDACWLLGRSQTLIDFLLRLPDLDHNTPAIYGVAVGYAMQRDRSNSLNYLEQAADQGDFHLFASKTAVVFDFLAQDYDFKSISEKCKANHYRRIADISGNPVF